MVTEPKLVIYTRPDCSYSLAAKDDLDRMEIPYREIDLSVHPEFVSEVEQLTGGERITPVMVEDGLVTVGYMGIG